MAERSFLDHRVVLFPIGKVCTYRMTSLFHLLMLTTQVTQETNDY